MKYPIKPCPKPRMSSSDRWRRPVRPEVARYWAFKDECRLTIKPEHHDLVHAEVTFCMPMPQSWSKKKKAEHLGKPHTSRPDLDNLFKALADALHIEDSHIHTIRASKVWAMNEGIVIDMEN
jgi:Holliday junction resolvase RusA-like endonuclease